MTVLHCLTVDRGSLKMAGREESKPQTAVRFLLLGALLGSLFLVFLPVFRFGFSLFDDHMYLTENPIVQAGLTLNGVIWAFMSTTANLWHPLTLVSHMVVVQLFGMEPGMHHLSSLLLHMINTLLLCLILTRMTTAFWPSFFTAALFALHPLHVESVVWLSARKDLLSTLFWLLAMRSYHAYVTATRRRQTLYLLTLALFTAGLMAKPMVVTLPFVLLLLDYWPLGRLTLPDGSSPVSVAVRLRPLLMEKLPFFALSFVASVINFMVQEGGKRYAALIELSTGEHVAAIFNAYIAYIGKMLLPINLAVVYPLNPGSVPYSLALLGGMLIVGATWAAIRFSGLNPAVTVGWFWYLGTLVPVIGIVRVGIQSMADRYTYLTLIGLFMAVSWGGAAAARRFRVNHWVIAVSALVVLTTCALVSRKQVDYWRDDLTLFHHASLATKDNWYAYSRLSALMLLQGRNNEGLGYADKALALRHNDAGAHYTRGVALLNLNQLDDAEKALKEALQYDIGMNVNDIQVNLGILYCIRGDVSSARKVQELLSDSSPRHAAILEQKIKGILPASPR